MALPPSVVTVADAVAYFEARDASREARLQALEGDATPAPVLSALSLAANSITENAASGTVVGGIIGKTAGSTFSLANDDGGRFAISGTNLVAGLTNIDYEAATSRSIVLRETLAGATNSPRDTPLAVGVINVNEQPSLRALLLSSTSLTIGTPATGSITEAATGSAIAASGLPAGFTVNGPARTWAYDGSGPASTSTVTLTETLGDSPNSPRATQIAVTVAAATPAITPMPSGLVDAWDPATLSLADGAVVPNWASSMGGTTTAYTSDSGAKHTFVANSGGLPAVRTSGQAVLAASNTSAISYTTLNGTSPRSFVVVARNVLAPTDNAGLSCLASLDGGGSNPNLVLQAFPDKLGVYNFTVPRPSTTALSIVGFSEAAGAVQMFSANGTCISKRPEGFLGHVNIGGWANRATQFCGRADVLAVLVFNRGLTVADYLQIQRRYRDLLGETQAGKQFVAIGDSLTASDAVGAGIPSQAGLLTSYPYLMAQRRGMPLGTWHNLGYHGMTWDNIRNGVVPTIGDVSAVTKTRTVVGMFEFANMRTTGASGIITAAQSTINAVKAICSNADIVFGTSTDDGSSAGVSARANRADYNNRTASLTGVAAFANIHLDPNIGVEGAAPTNGTANTYYRADGLHLLQPGNVLLDSGPNGIGTAAASLLS